MVWTGGAQRTATAIRIGARDLAGDRVPGSREWNDMMAGAAEDFACRFFGVFSAKIADGLDAGWDLALKDGRRVDVKWTPRDDGHLLCDMESKTKAEVFLLVVGEDPNDLLIAGWATREELFSSVINLGYRDTYGLAQDVLHTIDELV